MELRHLRYFVAVADELHFGRAADKLHISQPPLSHQIQDLERELGVDLFHRTRHFVALTEAGRAFLEEALPILEATDHAVATARKAGRAEVGRLSVGVGHASETRVLGKALNAFLVGHSNVVLDLHTLDSREQIEALANRRIDIAFPILPVSHRDIVAETIATEPLVAALPAAHRLACARRLRLADLRSDPFVGVLPDESPALHELISRACAEAGFAPAIVHEAGHVLTVLGLVGAGLGVAIVPGLLGSRPTEGVVFRPLTRAPSVQIGVAYRRNEMSTLLLAFLNVVRQVSQRKHVRPLRASVGA
jgi:DNA-binding transcriptional LysR family regulator